MGKIYHSKPNFPPAPGKAWVQVLTGFNRCIWVERSITDPDYIRSTESAKNAKGDYCTVRTITEVECGPDPYIQSAFENHMRKYASGGMTRFQKGGHVYREYHCRKRKGRTL